MVNVLTYGTFDCLHYGHLLFLERASRLGNFLIVGISTDEFNAQKGKRARFDVHERRRMVAALRYVDQTILEESWDQKRRDIEAHQIDTLVMGDDWQGKFDELRDVVNVVYLPRTPEVSSSLIRAALDDPTRTSSTD